VKTWQRDVVLGACLWLVCGCSAAATLVYEGFVAGIRVGSATVEVAIVDGHYQISGSAAADGVVDWFSDWRSEFTAIGQLTGNRPTPTQYAYSQYDGKSHREVRVRGGEISYRKNGRPPRQSAAFDTPDLLTALFVYPRCPERRWINTGRRNYRVERRSWEQGVCHLEVFDRHNDGVKVDLILGRRFGLSVPTALIVHGLVRARLVLVEGPRPL
jgi:hypothetical protein